MTDSEIKLKKCPFCGTDSAKIVRYGDSRKSTIYECGECGCTLETSEEFNHGEYWNRRPQYDKVVEQNESLQTELKQKTQECEGLKRQYNNLCKYQLEEKSRIEQDHVNFIDEIIRYKQALDEITDICCAKTKNCHMGCFICSTKCNENKILDIIKKAKEVNNEG